MSKVLFILMPDYRDEEFVVPHEMLVSAGHIVDVAGLQEGTIKGSVSHEHTPNMNFNQMKKEDFVQYDALVIPGGPGSTKYLWGNKEIQNVIKQFHENKKLIAAICYAVIVVVQTGLLLHKHATVFPTNESKSIFAEYGVKFSKDGLVSLHDERIITAQGPKFAKDFGQAIINMLQG